MNVRPLSAHIFLIYWLRISTLRVPAIGWSKINALAVSLFAFRVCNGGTIRSLLSFTHCLFLFFFSLLQLQQRWRRWLCSCACVWSFLLWTRIWILAYINYRKPLILSGHFLDEEETLRAVYCVHFNPLPLSEFLIGHECLKLNWSRYRVKPWLRVICLWRNQKYP